VQWIITRERADAERNADEWRAQGLFVRCIPLIERRELAWPDLVPPEPSVVMVTSAAVSRVLALRWKWIARAVEKRSILLACMDGETFRSLSLPVEIQEKGGVVALARAIALRYPKHPVLYPTSVEAISRPEHANAKSLLPKLHAFAVYETRACQVIDLVGLPECGWTFFSPSGVNALLPRMHEVPPPKAVICLGTSTAVAAQAFPAAWPKPIVVHDGQAVLAAIHSYKG
jgi:uroporphyrinogen-III synthase